MSLKNHFFKKISAAVLGLFLAFGISAQTVTYFHNDISGSPAVATDAAGAVVWKESYAPYGEKFNNQPAGVNNAIWFAGKPYDASTGLSYMGARYYDPVLGRFTGIDPVDFQESNIHSFNRYAYANNNPHKYIDKDGKYAEIAFEALSLALGIDSARKNFNAGNYGAAMVDGFGVLADAALTVVPGAPGVVGLSIKASRQGSEALVKETITVQRWMSKAELEATQNTGLLRGGREGTHYVTDAANSDQLRARQRLALEKTPEVRVTMEVPKDAFSTPSRVNPAFNMPGGGMERTATGNVPVRIKKVD